PSLVSRRRRRKRAGSEADFPMSGFGFVRRRGTEPFRHGPRRAGTLRVATASCSAWRAVCTETWGAPHPRSPPSNERSSPMDHTLSRESFDRPEDFFRKLERQRRSRVAMVISGMILGIAVLIGATALMYLDTPKPSPATE